ncbi:MAG: diguanylate cyclase [Wenzhouxiangella sp.]|jgi:diguanylate cyclase (GGDEF)-like protein/PAS domain S-box-containing protein|nr:diguanylate cyclase [Wenzhouxiangella sp.]
MPEEEAGFASARKDRSECLEPTERWETEGGSLASKRVRHGTPNHPSKQLSAVVCNLLDAIPLAVIISNRHGEIIFCNPACEALCGRSASQLHGILWQKLLDSRDWPILPGRSARQWIDSQHQAFEARLASQTGALIWTRQIIAPWSMDLTKEVFIHVVEDISVNKAKSLEASAEKAELARDREHARFTLECIGDAVISIDVQGRVSYMNKVAEQLTGWTREKALGQAFMDVFRVVDTNDRTAAENPAQLAVDADGIVQLAANCSLLRPDGSELEIEDSAAPIKDADGRPSGAVVVFRDRRYSRATSSKMSYLARHDALTGVGNRIALFEQIDQAIYLADKNAYGLAVLFTDLDNFKIINDALGHNAGDRMLRHVAEALTASVRDTDSVFRYGGDEFVVLLKEIGQTEDASGVACKLQETVGQRMRKGLESNVRLSVGISLYPGDASTSDGLLRAADIAMYQAKILRKHNEGPGHCFFHPDMLSTGRPNRRRNNVGGAKRPNQPDQPE